MDGDLLRQIYLAGTANCKQNGGLFDGGYRVDLPPEEVLERIEAVRRGERDRETGEGPLARLMDDHLDGERVPATLLYHFCPWDKRPGMVDFHGRCLGRYLPRFTKIRINIATGEHCLDPGAVEDRLREHLQTDDVRFYRTPNTELAECPAFFEKLLPEVGPGENTCFAHSKGAVWREARPSQLWAELMYVHLLTNPRRMARLLEEHACVGCFKKVGPWRGAQWYYAGTFFWFKDLDRWPGYKIPKIHDRFAVESWPGRFVPEREALGLLDEKLRNDLCYHQKPKLDHYHRLP